MAHRIHTGVNFRAFAALHSCGDWRRRGGTRATWRWRTELQRRRRRPARNWRLSRPTVCVGTGKTGSACYSTNIHAYRQHRTVGAYKLPQTGDAAARLQKRRRSEEDGHGARAWRWRAHHLRLSIHLAPRPLHSLPSRVACRAVACLHILTCRASPEGLDGDHLVDAIAYAWQTGDAARRSVKTTINATGCMRMPHYRICVTVPRRTHCTQLPCHCRL